jgi:rhombotail lipoprotein
MVRASGGHRCTREAERADSAPHSSCEGAAMKLRTMLCLATLGAALTGCSYWNDFGCAPHCRSETHNSSSLVSFLYPDGRTPPPRDATPELHLPLRIGLAFLPSQSPGNYADLDAAHKEQILERIRRRFADRKFVGEIVVIPDYYLKSSRGFEGLQGVQRLYSIDLMALVSYDQVTHRDDTNWSLTYLTIVGAFMFKATDRDVATMVDLAVVDPATQSLVLRAGGTDGSHGHSTLVEEQQDARLAGAESFDAASNQMIANFDAALNVFEASVREGHANVRVVDRNGKPTGGGGALGLIDVLFLSLLAAGRRLRIAAAGSAAA